MKNNNFSPRANRAMAKRRQAFTIKCLVKMADNNSLLGYNLASPADLHSTFLPIAPNYSLN